MADYRTVAQIGEINPGEAGLVSYGRIPVLLMNIDGTYHAIEDRCSHADVALSDGEINLNTCMVKCPKHGSEFDITTGAPQNPPAIMPVLVFDVRVEGDEVQIARPTKST
jgi:3-phenylpropionate/trans-cinnamate dioxygenase ferredoxin component